MRYMMAGLMAWCSCSTAQAQNVIHWPAPVAAATPGAKYYLPMGTPVMLRTLTHVSTKQSEQGDRFYLEVAENVMFGNHVVIPAGAPVVAEVSSVQRNGHLGRKGRIQVRLIEVQTPSGAVPLTGTASDEGKDQMLLSVGTILFVSTLGGFLIHGTSADIAAGTPVQAQLAQDMAFRAQPGEMSAAASAVPSNFRF